jgi:CubicO group peptidase (beta-lactamase class C family)
MASAWISGDERRRVRRWRCACACAAVFGLFAAATAPQSGARDLADLQRRAKVLVEEQMEAERIPGLSIALIDDQQLLWSAGFGYADVAARVPARADTIYPTGTLTMTLTAAAVMQLADRGALDPDDAIERVLPEFSMRHRQASAPRITPRQLMTHHAGLPAMRLNGMWTREPESLERLVYRLREEYLAGIPGEVHAPSHLGYSVLGRMIEVVSGRAFETYMREELLAPLGMRDSSFRLADLERTRLAKGYWRGHTETDTLPVRDTPAAGLYSTVNDLARFVQMLFAGGERAGRRMLGERTVRDLWRAQNERVELDLDTRVGLGWRLSGIRLKGAPRVVWQYGSSPIGRGRMVVLPESRLAVVVLGNSSGGARALEKVSEEALAMLLEGRESPKQLAQLHEAVPERGAVSGKEFAGHYASMVGLVTVTAEGARVRAAMLNKLFGLDPRPDGLYDIDYRLLGFLPVSFGVLKEVSIQPARLNGQHYAIVRYRDHVLRFAQRFEPQPLTPAWQARLGEYHVTGKDALLELIEMRPLRLVHEDGVLFFRYRWPGWLGLVVQVPVRPVSDTELVLEGNGWLMGETIRVVRAGGEERLAYSGYELRRVRQ